MTSSSARTTASRASSTASEPPAQDLKAALYELVLAVVEETKP